MERLIHNTDYERDDDVAGLVDAIDADAENYAASYSRQAEWNITWYAGQQECFFNADTGRMELQPNPQNRVRLIVNLMRGLIDGAVAKINQARINLVGSAATDDIEDYERAVIHTHVLRYIDRQQRLPNIVARDDMNACLTGEGIVKIVWDPFAGEPLTDLQPDDVGMSPEKFAEEYGEDLQDLSTGDVSVSNVNPFNFYWGPEGVELKDADYALEVFDRSVSYCIERYGLDPDDLPENTQGGTVREWQPGRAHPTGDEPHEPTPGILRVQELWVRRIKGIKGLERGRHIVKIGDRVVVNDENPYNHGRLPYIGWKWEEVTGEPRGQTPVSDLIAPQADINRTLSQMCENRETMANPVWLVEEGSVVDWDQWDNQPGGAREYRGGANVPQIAQGASMPNLVMMTLQMQKQHMQEIIGLRDVSTAKNPPGVRSGKAIAMLKEADEERLAQISERREEAWLARGQMMLAVFEQFAEEDRVVRVTGDENEPYTVVVSAPLMRRSGTLPGASFYDVELSTKGLPNSLSVRQALVDMLMERGFLRADRPDDVALVMDMLQLGSTRRPVDRTKDGRNLQARRNELMIRGQYEAPQHYEPLEIMLGEMNRFRSRPFFVDADESTRELFNRYEVEAMRQVAMRKLIARAAIGPIAQAAAQLAGPGRPTAAAQAAQGGAQGGQGRPQGGASGPTRPQPRVVRQQPQRDELRRNPVSSA